MHFVVLPEHFGVIEIIPNFFELQYITNKGMAFGMELGGEYGKLLLTSFRLVAAFVIIWYLNNLAQKESTHPGLLFCMAAILAGALGNLIDSIFYGVYLGIAPYDAASPWFHGQVIDMFYFKGLNGIWPDWLPFIGGQSHYTPIFNFADACIFCGVLTILVFQNKLLGHEQIHKITPSEEEIIENVSNEIEN
jgi:signal peptidase II